MLRYADAEGVAMERRIVSVADFDAIARELPVLRAAGAVVDAVRWLTARVRAKVADMRTFSELDSLDDRMLADIGVTRGEIRARAAANRDDHPLAA